MIQMHCHGISNCMKGFSVIATKSCIVAILACAMPLTSTRAERCFTVYGRMSLSNGTPGVRIWKIGTTRVFGVLQQDATFDDLPRNIRTVWAAHGDEWNTYLFGNFQVCPTDRDKPGYMRMVNVVKGTALWVKAIP